MYTVGAVKRCQIDQSAVEQGIASSVPRSEATLACLAVQYAASWAETRFEAAEMWVCSRDRVLMRECLVVVERDNKCARAQTTR